MVVVVAVHSSKQVLHYYLFTLLSSSNQLVVKWLHFFSAIHPFTPIESTTIIHIVMVNNANAIVLHTWFYIHTFICIISANFRQNKIIYSSISIFIVSAIHPFTPIESTTIIHIVMANNANAIVLHVWFYIHTLISIISTNFRQNKIICYLIFIVIVSAI